MRGARAANRSMLPSLQAAGRAAMQRHRGEAGRGRHRHRQQRRAAARLVPLLHPRPPERARRLVAAAPARRRRALSDLHEGVLRGFAQEGIGRRHPRPAQGDRRDRLSGCRRGEGRVRGLPRRARCGRQSVRRAVPHRALARHGVGDRAERALHRARRNSSPRSAARCASNTRRSSMRASCCSSTARIWRARGTTPSRTGRSAISSRSATAWSTPSTRRSTTFRPSACACTCAGATTRARTISTWSSTEIIPFLKRAKVGGFVLPFANPRHAHEYRYLKDLIGQGPDHRGGRDRYHHQLRRASRGDRRAAGERRARRSAIRIA